MESLKDQIAVVTGASSGIGKAIALSIAEHGAEVCLVARRRELLDDVAKQVHALGSRGHACPADLTKDEDIRALGERCQKDFGRVNILVLCGGAIFHGSLAKASLADFDLIEINEAFAAQSLACLRQLGLKDDAEHVNPNGGAIALGHPLGMSGARLALTAAHQLARQGGRRAIATLCVGVGQGLALALERVE